MPQDIIFYWQLMDGTAKRGSDFDVTSGTYDFGNVTLPAGQIRGALDLLILGDRQMEGDERFTVRIYPVTGPPVVATRTDVVVTIADDDGQFLQSSIDVLAGTTASLRLVFGSAVAVDSTITLESSLPTVASVPASVIAPAGARSVSFDVTARRAGHTRISARYEGKSFEATVNVIETISVPTFLPPALDLLTGTTATVRIRLEPPAREPTIVALKSSDSSVVTVPSSVTVTSAEEIAVRAVRAGTATIEAMLPGGQSVTLPVRVTNPPRRRATR